MRTHLGQISLDLSLLALSLPLERTGCLVMTPRGGVSAVRTTTAFPINSAMHRRRCGLAASCWAAGSAGPWHRPGSCNLRENLSCRDRTTSTTAMVLPPPPPLRGGGCSGCLGRLIVPAGYMAAPTASMATLAPSAAITYAKQRSSRRESWLQAPPMLQAPRLRPHNRVGDYRSYSTRLTSTAASTAPPADQQHETAAATDNNTNSNINSNNKRDNAMEKTSREVASQEDTIFALSTGNAGPAGVAVVRVSGPRSAQVLEALTRSRGAMYVSQSPSGTDEKGRGGEGGTRSGNGGRTGPPLPAPRRATVRRLYDPPTGDVLDEALVLWMPGPRSFTGEDTVELHTHGSRAVINGVLDALGGLRGWGVRMAERGEFTQRAYDNGRMDLTGVEGLADLIAADTAAQRKQALRQMGGALRDKYEAWRDELKECLAHAEAVIDFGDDEEDVGGDAAFFGAAVPRAAALAMDMEAHLKDGGRGEIVRSGLRAAIVGPPNAGKSSLLNLLAARPAAIVSPVAGTTRDVVEVQLDIAGLPVTLSDTAGLRDATVDDIEREGMRRALTTVDNAHLAIFVADGSDPGAAVNLLRRLRQDAAAAKAAESPGMEDREGVGATGEDLGGLAGTATALEDVIVVLNKADLLEPQTAGQGEDGSSLGALVEEASARRVEGKGRVWKLSCKTREGVEEFVVHLEAVVGARFRGAADDEPPLITRRRHRQHVEACLEALRAAQNPTLPLDLAAEELRIASAELGRITGAVDVEELLDVIFRDFCIGK